MNALCAADIDAVDPARRGAEHARRAARAFRLPPPAGVSAEHHCENRHDPESDCNGYCILKKHVAERAHDDAHSNLAFSHVMFYLAPETASPSVSGTPEPPLHSHYVPPSADAYVGDLDPPPRFG